jgi:tRNA uridine 5-carboxymethylaminomethyl modification enzyme
LQQLQTRIKYEGYIQRQVRQVQSLNEQENKLIPESFAYDSISSISNEAREKLKKVRPRSLGQAARISGVSPADIAVLLIHLKRRSQKAEVFHVEHSNNEADPHNDRK